MQNIGNALWLSNASNLFEYTFSKQLQQRSQNFEAILTA